MNMEQNHPQQDDLYQMEIRDLMIPATKVAFVNTHNTLEHALLILTQSGYTTIPVLDRKSAVVGIINTTLIIKAILGIRGYDTDKLGELTVETVMAKDIPRMKDSQSFFRAFELSINLPFVCVENEEGTFAGILTRRTVLAQLYQNERQRLPGHKARSVDGKSHHEHGDG